MDETTDDALVETDGFITVVMPNGEASTVNLLQLHVDQIKAAMQEGDEPADAVIRLIERGSDIEAYGECQYMAGALSNGKGLSDVMSALAEKSKKGKKAKKGGRK